MTKKSLEGLSVACIQRWENLSEFWCLAVVCQPKQEDVTQKIAVNMAVLWPKWRKDLKTMVM